jgi:hypothetical protein
MAKDNETLQMIEDCEKRQSQLSEWETNFINSISYQLETKGGLSTMQYATLESIWDKLI